MEKLIKGIIIGVIVGLIIGGVSGYFLHNAISRNLIQRRGNFQITEAQINEVTSFFDNTLDINEINSYCGQNRQYCVYYCRNINPEHEICEEISNFSRMPGGKMP